MEVKTTIILIAIITSIAAIVIILMGCNEQIESFEIECADYSKIRPPSGGISQFEKCIIKHDNRENLCHDYFWWLRW